MQRVILVIVLTASLLVPLAVVGCGAGGKLKRAVACSDCSGSGKCPGCDGTKRILIFKCGFCNGTGDCSSCKGWGVK